MKIAIVTDWLVVYGGAEKVLEQILEVFPKADLFSLVDFLPDDKRFFIKNKKVHTSFIQKLPFARSKYRNYLPLMPMAIEQFDLSKYDVVISSSYAVAKGVITGPDQLHISYVHSPMRYAWDLQFQYLKEAGLTHGIKSALVKYMLHRLRMWDSRTANGVDTYIANSLFIRRRINKVYGRESTVIYPPVDLEKFEVCFEKSDFYLTASRLVPYKKIDLIADAFSKMPDKSLVIIGDGPDFNKIKRKAGNNVKMLGYQSDKILQEYMQKAKGFVFAAEEDFGIVPVEAQACGTPVIAYGKGGALETIRGLECKTPTGIFYSTQDANSIIGAINEFEKKQQLIKPEVCRENAMSFSTKRFKREFSIYVEKKIKEFNDSK